MYFQSIKREPGWEMATQLLLASAREDIQLVASTLLLSEVCGYNGSVEDPTRQDSVADRFLEENPRIEWVELDRFVAREGRALSRQHRLRGGDAVHLATAVMRECEYFMSDDKRFPYGRRIKKTQVTRPRQVWQPTLDDLRVESMADEVQS